MTDQHKSSWTSGDYIMAMYLTMFTLGIMSGGFMGFSIARYCWDLVPKNDALSLHKDD
jgi:hypothetical protein